MRNSIFKNFDPDELKVSFNAGTSFGAAPSLFLVILTAAHVCGKWEVNEDGRLRCFRELTNDEFVSLDKNVNDLAKIGFENRATLPWFESDAESIEFDEYSTHRWACHGRECKKNSEATLTQINGICALWLIDDAMTAAASNGITVEFIEALSEAAFYLSEARSAQSEELIDFTGSAVTSNLEYKFREMQRKSASRKAAIRYSNDPKQKEKTFVLECWRGWQAKPEQYKGKATFARAMLDKCEHLTSQKKIEDWCREWEADAKTVPLPAQ